MVVVSVDDDFDYRVLGAQCHGDRLKISGIESNRDGVASTFVNTCAGGKALAYDQRALGFADTEIAALDPAARHKHRVAVRCDGLQAVHRASTIW